MADDGPEIGGVADPARPVDGDVTTIVEASKEADAERNARTDAELDADIEADMAVAAEHHAVEASVVGGAVQEEAAAAPAPIDAPASPSSQMAAEAPHVSSSSEVQERAQEEAETEAEMEAHLHVGVSGGGKKNSAVPASTSTKKVSKRKDDSPKTVADHKQTAKAGSKASGPASQPAATSGFPKDFDWSRHEETHQLVDENAALRKQLAEQTSHVQHLEEALVTLKDELVEAEDGDSPQQAFKDLAKKHRALTLTLERERHKNAKLADEIEKYKTDIAALEQQGLTRGGTLAPRFGKSVLHQPHDASTPSPVPSHPDTRELKDKYDRVLVRLRDVKTETQQVRALLVKHQRALQREVGEEVPLDRVLEATGKWRGRAQEISLLRAQIADLRVELQQTRSGSGSVVSSSIDAGTQDPRALKEAQLLQAHQKELDQIRAARVEEIKRLQQEKAAADQEIVRLKQKSNSVNARIQSLEQLYKGSKEKMKLLLDKSDNDDKLIDGLRNELERRRQHILRLTERSRLSDDEEGLSAHGGMQGDGELHMPSAGHGTASSISAALAATAAARAQPQQPRSSSSAAAAAAAATAALRDRDETIAQQKQQLLELREEVHRMRQQRVSQLEALSSDWDRSEKDHKIQLLHVESEKRRELAALYARQMEELKTQLAELARRNSELESRREALEIRLGKQERRSGSATSSLSTASASGSAAVGSLPKLQAQLAAVREKLDVMTREKASLEQQRAASAAQHEEQLRVLNEALAQQKTVYQKAVNGLRQQFLEIQSKIDGSRPAGSGSLSEGGTTAGLIMGKGGSPKASGRTSASGKIPQQLQQHAGSLDWQAPGLFDDLGSTVPTNVEPTRSLGQPKVAPTSSGGTTAVSKPRPTPAPARTGYASRAGAVPTGPAIVAAGGRQRAK